MPELPDVAMMRRYLQATSLHQEVGEVEVRDSYVLKDVSPDELRDALTGRSFGGTTRHGKNLLVELDEGPWLRLHFGMTGNLKYFRDPAGDPEHDRILISFTGGYHLAYDCRRKLGRVSLEESPRQFVEDKDLGPDALDVSWEEFREIMGRRRGALNNRLMDQHVLAGIGNVYADEIMFQARFHPRAPVEELTEEDLNRLFRADKEVLRGSIDRGADARDLPEARLIGHRGEGEECPRCGAEIRRIKMNQRSCYFCPRCQPAP